MLLSSRSLTTTSTLYARSSLSLSLGKTRVSYIEPSDFYVSPPIPPIATPPSKLHGVYVQADFTHQIRTIGIIQERDTRAHSRASSVIAISLSSAHTRNPSARSLRAGSTRSTGTLLVAPQRHHAKSQRHIHTYVCPPEQ